jgi:hypothetical protein
VIIDVLVTIAIVGLYCWSLGLVSEAGL